NKPKARFVRPLLKELVSWICIVLFYSFYFFFSSRRRHTRFSRDWSSDVCSSDLHHPKPRRPDRGRERAWRGHPLPHPPAHPRRRSEERRVGKECRSRWSRCQ